MAGFGARRPLAEAAGIPRASPLWVRLFTRYSQRYVARHFHSVRLSGPEPLVPAKLPVVIYLNHGSWWDPLVCLVLAGLYFKNRPVAAPIDAAALQRYRFLGRLGFFGVRGGAGFLRHSLAILSRPEGMLWLTPEGRFTDARSRPLAFKPGLGHLASRLEQAVFLPLAIEYTFWTERTPEILVRFGDPILSDGHPWTPAEWSAYLERNLTSTMNTLARESIARNAASFRMLLTGRSGVGLVYDSWRAVRAWLRGESFSREHGQ